MGEPKYTLTSADNMTVECTDHVFSLRTWGLGYWESHAPLIDLGDGCTGQSML